MLCRLFYLHLGDSSGVVCLYEHECVVCALTVWQRDWLMGKQSVSVSEDAQQGPLFGFSQVMSSSLSWSLFVSLSFHSLMHYFCHRQNKSHLPQSNMRKSVNKGRIPPRYFNDQWIGLLRLFRVMSWWNRTLSLSSICSLQGHTVTLPIPEEATLVCTL